MNNQQATYLTIDLDYWKVFPESFLLPIFELNIPIAVAIHHHHLLPHMNKFSNCSRLINIDHHVDLCGNMEKDEVVNCGTWGSRVTWRNKKRSSFLWVHPSEKCLQGKTNMDGGCWCDNEDSDNPFFSKTPSKLCGWSKVSTRMAPIITCHELESVVAVGICVSPDFLDKRAMGYTWTKQLLDMANRYKAEICEDHCQWESVLNGYKENR